MIAVWALFALMVYVLEPLVLHRLFHDFALRQGERAFALAANFHLVALCVSAVAIIAGVSVVPTAVCRDVAARWTWIKAERPSSVFAVR